MGIPLITRTFFSYLPAKLRFIQNQHHLFVKKDNAKGIRCPLGIEFVSFTHPRF